MSSVNKVIILGNVGQDPEIRNFESGGRVCNLSIATSEKWKDKNTGEARERTEWHRVAIFNDGLVGVCEQYVRKGAKLYVEGQLETRKWQDQNGQDRYSTEVVLRQYRGNLVMLGDRQQGQDQNQGQTQGQVQQQAQPQQVQQAAQPQTQQQNYTQELDDEIPF